MPHNLFLPFFSSFLCLLSLHCPTSMLEQPLVLGHAVEIFSPPPILCSLFFTRFLFRILFFSLLNLAIFFLLVPIKSFSFDPP